MSKQNKTETMGQRIKAMRIKLGMTQEELADKMFIPKLTVSAYENDKVDIKSSVLMELSRVLQTSPNYLLGYEEDDFVEETSALLGLIEDEKVRKLLLVQIKAMVDMG